jgi:GTPase Era involved in 16S rRNA processing
LRVVCGRGETIKRIGTEARRDIEALFGTHVFLDLHVKVLANWRERPDVIRQLDWRLQLEQISAAQNPDADPESVPDP